MILNIRTYWKSQVFSLAHLVESILRTRSYKIKAFLKSAWPDIQILRFQHQRFACDLRQQWIWIHSRRRPQKRSSRDCVPFLLTAYFFCRGIDRPWRWYLRASTVSVMIIPDRSVSRCSAQHTKLKIGITRKYGTSEILIWGVVFHQTNLWRFYNILLPLYTQTPRDQVADGTI